ncbi:hypothetical protein ACFL3G_01505 [Planctomycetota bacterium]
MTHGYGSLCDDFYVDMYVNTELDLPASRDTILSFFERVQKQYPSMGNFYRGDNNEYCLEEDRSSGQYRWVSLEVDRIYSGMVNPRVLEDAYEQDRLILEIMPYMLSVNHLDIDSLDVSFTMDFEYSGSHDEVIAEALFASTAFGCFGDVSGAKAIGFSPAVIISLSDDNRRQARISVESKTSVYEPDKRKKRNDESISLSFTIRQYPGTSGVFDARKSFDQQCQLLEELMAEKIVPNFVGPLTDVIAQKKLS